MKVLVTHWIPGDGLDGIKTRHEVIAPPDGVLFFTKEQILEKIADSDAVLAGGLMDAQMINAGKQLKIIANYGAGYDRVDVAEATKLKIPLTNIPEETCAPTAEVAFALILATSRRVCELDKLIRQGPPENAFGMGRHMGHSLFSRTLGIVGMGRIGRQVARIARAFDMNIVYYNRNRLPHELEHGATWLPLTDLLKCADVVSLNCPLTDETRGLIGEAELALIKPTAILVNTARGAVIDTDALVSALKNNVILAAGLDVYPNEPHVPEALLTLDNVVLTPHIGTNTHEARSNMAAACAYRIEEVFAGRRPPNVVNPSIYL